MEFSTKDTKVVKGIAIMLMIYHHLFTFPDRMPNNVLPISLFTIAGNTISYWIGSFGKLCVALFIFLAGYGTYISARNTNQTENAFITNKLRKLYIIYWKVFIIFIPICMLLNISPVSKDIETLIWNFLGINVSYNGEWWFFTPYVFLIILFPITKKILGSKDSFWQDIIIILSLTTLIRYIIPTFGSYQWGSNLNNSLFWVKLIQALDLLPSFLIGCICAKYNLFSKAKEKFRSNNINSLLALLIMFIIFYMRKRTGIVYDYIYAPIFTISSIIFLNNSFLSFLYTLFEKIGNESTIIWLTHSFYCYMICPQLVYYPRFSILIAIWLCFICYLTSKGINLLYNSLNKIRLKKIENT
ncbi:acyltransferase family protein [Clostridioides sp. GD02377]|uniref:acyltransferase family protein n=1 Tax=unclassified Clostridioides TaxID=2635829 RepID=UPI00389C2779